MIMLAIAGVLVGALLGMYFRVFILVPVVLLAVAITVSVGLAFESGGWWITLEVAVAMITLELGYLGGNVATRMWSRSRKAPLGGEAVRADDYPPDDKAHQSRNVGAGQRLRTGAPSRRS